MIATSPRITNYGAASATSCRWAPPLAPPLPSFICTAPSRRTTATYEDSALLEGITVGRSVSNSCGNLHLPHRFSHPRFCILNFVSRGAEAHDARSRSRSLDSCRRRCSCCCPTVPRLRGPTPRPAFAAQLSIFLPCITTTLYRPPLGDYPPHVSRLVPQGPPIVIVQIQPH